MNEVEPDQPVAASAAERVGDRLRAARTAAGLSLAEVAERTRVPLRHLQAIEGSDFAALPSPTYALGFARAYARAVGLDEVKVARDVRGELGKLDRAPEYVPYETADPNRVPSRGVAILGLGAALAILILVGLWYGTDLFRGDAGGDGTRLATAATPATVTAPLTSQTPAAARQVTLTAGANEVWMRVYDANDDTLYLGTLASGAKFDVPPAASRPMINVGRPDQLQVTLDGRAVPPLGDGRRAIKDVPVDAASIAARLTGGPTPAPSVAAAPSPSAAPAARPTPRAERRRESSRPAARATGSPRSTPTPDRDGPENLLPNGFGPGGA